MLVFSVLRTQLVPHWCISVQPLFGHSKSSIHVFSCFRRSCLLYRSVTCGIRMLGDQCQKKNFHTMFVGGSLSCLLPPSCLKSPLGVFCGHRTCSYTSYNRYNLPICLSVSLKARNLVCDEAFDADIPLLCDIPLTFCIWYRTLTVSILRLYRFFHVTFLGFLYWMSLEKKKLALCLLKSLCAIMSQN